MAKYFRLSKIEEENNNTFDKSKILGSPVFPSDFLIKNGVNDDLFIAQINLTEFDDERLPNSGYIYFFLNIDKYPYQAKVIYTEEEMAEVCDLINEDFPEFGDPIGYLMEEIDSYDGFAIVSDIDENLDLDSQVNTENMICLLELDSISLPNNVLTLGQPDGWYMFLIDKNDLTNKNFDNVIFISYGS